MKAMKSNKNQPEQGAMRDHVVTQQDLDTDSDLGKQGVNVGDTIQIPVDEAADQTLHENYQQQGNPAQDEAEKPNADNLPQMAKDAEDLTYAEGDAERTPESGAIGSTSLTTDVTNGSPAAAVGSTNTAADAANKQGYGNQEQPNSGDTLDPMRAARDAASNR